MNGHLNDDVDDLIVLASAYLDGEATPDERARVESAPELLAEVERLRSVAALLADVEPARISQREEHLATALDAWDRLPEAERSGVNRDRTPGAIARGADSVVAATPTSLARRRQRVSTNRRLLGAAAALVVVLGGGVALQVARSGDDGGPVADQAESDAAAGAELTEEASRAAPQAADDAADGAGTDGQDLAQAEAAPGATQLDTGILDAAPPAERVLEQLRSTEDLRDFASAAVGAPSAPDVPAATSAPIDDLLTDEQRAVLEAEWPLCLGADVVVGPALYGDVEVLVAIDEGRDLALAYVAATCNEVARARLP